LGSQNYKNVLKLRTSGSVFAKMAEVGWHLGHQQPWAWQLDWLDFRGFAWESFFINLTKPFNPYSQILMKLNVCVELIILEKMIPILTKSVAGFSSYA